MVLRASAFHELLQQLGETHDRELAYVQATCSRCEVGGCDVLSELSHKSRRKMGALDRLLDLRSEQSSRHRKTDESEEAEEAEQGEVMCRKMAQPKEGSLPLQEMNTNGLEDSTRATSGPADSGRITLTSADRAGSKLRELPRLHPQWVLEPEDLNTVKGFAFPMPQNCVSRKNSSLSGGRGLGLCQRLAPNRPQLQILWDFGGIFCILFDLIWIPVQLCFGVELSLATRTLEWTIRLFWTFDLLLKARQTAQQFDAPCGHCAFLLWRMLRKHIFDLLVVLLDWVPLLLQQTGENADVFGLLRIGKVPRILRILRVLRLARMMKLEHFFFALRDSLLVSSESVSLSLGLLKNMLCVLMLSHLCTCVGFLVGDGETEDHWVYFHGLHGPEVPLMVKYLWSFHWVASQWTPAGMEVFPRNDGERLFTVVLLVGGVLVFSTTMGAITASMTRLRNISGNELSQFFLLRHYLYENHISRSLSVRICRYADLALEMHRKRIDQESVRHLKLLSGPLHVELQKEIYLPHLQRHAFFAGYVDWDAAAMSHLCFAALGREFVGKGDMLFSQGAEAFKMYCTVNGTCIYKRRRGLGPLVGKRPKRMVRVPSGTWFAEASLWVRWSHTGSMCALIESEIVQVDAEKFREVTRSRESVFSRSALYARAFSRSMLDENDCTWDLPPEMMYTTAAPTSSARNFWWQREVVDAEIAEAEWLANNGDSSSEDEDGSHGLTEFSRKGFRMEISCAESAEEVETDNDGSSSSEEGSERDCAVQASEVVRVARL